MAERQSVGKWWTANTVILICALFPVLWILANRRSIAMRRGWPMVSAGLFAIIAVLSFGGYWVP